MRATGPCTGPATRQARSWPSRSSSSVPSSCCAPSDPQTGIPSVAWRIREGRGPRLHALRHGRPAPGPWVAGARLSADRRPVRRRRPAHPGSPGGEPGPRHHPARGHEGRRRPLRLPPGHRVHDQGGVREASATSDGATCCSEAAGVGTRRPDICPPSLGHRRSSTVRRPSTQEAWPAHCGRAVGRPRAGVARVRPARPRRGRS